MAKENYGKHFPMNDEVLAESFNIEATEGEERRNELLFGTPDTPTYMSEKDAVAKLNAMEVKLKGEKDN